MPMDVDDSSTDAMTMPHFDDPQQQNLFELQLEYSKKHGKRITLPEYERAGRIAKMVERGVKFQNEVVLHVQCVYSRIDPARLEARLEASLPNRSRHKAKATGTNSW